MVEGVAINGHSAVAAALLLNPFEKSNTSNQNTQTKTVTDPAIQV